VYTEQDFPLEWAGTQYNLGLAWFDLPTDDRGSNLRQAIACNEAALRVYTEQDFPQIWAMTQNILGDAWFDLPTDDRDPTCTKPSPVMRQPCACTPSRTSPRSTRKSGRVSGLHAKRSNTFNDRQPAKRDRSCCSPSSSARWPGLHLPALARYPIRPFRH